jgi:hypothetical protein
MASIEPLALATERLESIEYGPAPSALLFSETCEGAEQASLLAARAGWRVIDSAGIEHAEARLERQAAVDVVLFDVGRGECSSFERIERSLGEGKGDDRFGCILLLAPEAVDRVPPALWDAGLDLVCEPSEAEWLEVAARAAQPRTLRLHDVGKGRALPRLQQIKEDAQRVADALADLSAEEEAALRRDDHKDAPVDAGLIRSVIRVRRLRDQYLRSDLFADPAWDMLLDLMAARLEGRRVAVSSLCIAAAVPPTTALRWIKTLSDQGLIVRVADPEDGRRVFIELSEKTAESLEAYFSHAPRIGRLIV